VSEFYNIDPEWLKDVGEQYEPIIRAIETSEPFTRIQDIADLRGAMGMTRRVDDLV
jgi:hypothetical protein